MSIIFEERDSDSPYVETITRGETVSDGSTIRPAECHWHMVFSRLEGRTLSFIVGPWSEAGVVSYGEGADILWVRFRLGAFMPHLPTKDIRDTETVLPDASNNSFWLKGSARQVPDFEEVETFIERLAREEILVLDPVVVDSRKSNPLIIPPRTVRHHYLQATGLSQKHINQFERAQQAAALLQQGVPILDTVNEVGYYDQPHLTRSLKRFTGFTPAQMAGMHIPA